jgi:predicted HTH transcriptional regulator
MLWTDLEALLERGEDSTLEFNREALIPMPLPRRLSPLLLNLRILKSEERGVFPTVAGLSAFGKAPQAFLPDAEIQAAFYRGDSRTSEVLDQKTIIGTVTDQIEGAVSFVQKNMRVGSVIKDVKRVSRDLDF